MKKKINLNFINLIKNFSYSVGSNLTSLIISALVVLVVPRLIGVDEYGYWQLYLFYTSYIGFFHLGWIDGIYLKYGGSEYESLDKRVFNSQFYMLMISQVLIALALILVSLWYIEDVNRLFIMGSLAITLIITNLRYFILFTLQATNRIKEYSSVTITDRVIYALFLILLLVLGIRDYRSMIAMDILGRIVSFILAIYYVKDIVFRPIRSFLFTFHEMLDNIQIGIKLMFSNIANNLIIGTIKFGIERNWSIEVFGKVSLTLSISNLFMTFINAISLVIYPVLRRINQSKYGTIYSTMRDLLSALTTGLIIFYYPIRYILILWLPDYSESLMYMGLVFPIIIFQSKMSLLINTFLKSYRKEKIILVINIISVSFSALLTLITVTIMDNLFLSILSIVILLAFRTIIAEIYLSKLMNLSFMKNIVTDLLMASVFIILNLLNDSYLNMLFYGLSYALYLIINKEELLSALKKLKLMIYTNN